MTENPLPTSWPPPSQQTLLGHWVKLVPLDWDKHRTDLAKRATGPKNEDLWTYMPIGPFEDIDALKATLDYVRSNLGWVTFAIISNETQHTLGIISFMRIRPQYGSAEVGCVLYSHEFQRKTGGSEVIYLMAKYLFGTLNYRRFEWKCHNENDASKKAARRFGFQYEGLFRKDMVSKGKNRDTAWFSITDDEWPVIRDGFEKWLNPKNFDKRGPQIKSLEDCREHNV